MPQPAAFMKRRGCDVKQLRATRSSLRDTELSSSSSCESSVSVASCWSVEIDRACDSTHTRATATLRDWMYWQRESDANPSCWTKVFAVLRGEFMWLYQRKESAPKSLLLQLAVASVEVSGDRQLRVVDPNGEDINVCLLSADAFQCWRERLHLASELTDEYFRRSHIDAKDLPRDSIFRGTLIAYRQLSKRARCRAAMSKFARRWKRHVQDVRSEITSA